MQIYQIVSSQVSNSLFHFLNCKFEQNEIGVMAKGLLYLNKSCLY